MFARVVFAIDTDFVIRDWFAFTIKAGSVVKQHFVFVVHITVEFEYFFGWTLFQIRLVFAHSILTTFPSLFYSPPIGF